MVLHDFTYNGQTEASPFRTCGDVRLGQAVSLLVRKPYSVIRDAEYQLFTCSFNTGNDGSGRIVAFSDARGNRFRSVLQYVCQRLRDKAPIAFKVKWHLRR